MAVTGTSIASEMLKLGTWICYNDYRRNVSILGASVAIKAASCTLMATSVAIMSKSFTKMGISMLQPWPKVL